MIAGSQGAEAPAQAAGIARLKADALMIEKTQHLCRRLSARRQLLEKKIRQAQKNEKKPKKGIIY